MTYLKFYSYSDFCAGCGQYFVNEQDRAYHECVFE